MLRISRTSKGRPPAISLRENSRLLTPNFLRALGLAFGIHFVGVIIFHVHPYFIRNSPSPFPPVQVNVEPLLSTSDIFADTKVINAIETLIREPKWEEPPFPVLAKQGFDRTSAYPKPTPFPENVFIGIAEARSEPVWPEERPLKLPAVSVHVSGPLAEVPMAAAIKPDPINVRSLSGQQRALFAVKIENKSGKIFWHNLLDGNIKTKIKAHAEQILAGLQFQPLSPGITEGVVEISYHGKEEA